MSKEIIESAWEDRSLLKSQEVQSAIKELIAQLDAGKLRVAEPTENGWIVNDWIKKQLYCIFRSCR